METRTDRAESRETDKAILSSIASELLRITRNLETQTNAEIARFGKTWKYGDAAFALQRDAVQAFARVMRIAAAESLVDTTAAKIALTYPDDGNTWINYVGDLETHYRGATEAVTWKPEAIVQALRFVADKLAAKAIEPKAATEAVPRPAVAADPLKYDPMGRAMLLIKNDPKLSNEDIARLVDVNPKTLNKKRWKPFRDLRDSMRESGGIPMGSKTKDGDLEAWEDASE